MKGAKGGKRDKLISFLFSKKNKLNEKEETPNKKIQNTNINVNINKKEIKEEKDNKLEDIKEIKIVEEEIIPKVKHEEKEEVIIDTDILEKEIIEIVEDIVKDDLDELEEISYEIEVLNDDQKEEVITDETEELKDELQDLLGKFEKVKNKYYPDDLDDEQINIDYNLIYELVQDYKDEISNDIDEDKNNITIIQKINKVEDKSNEIEESIDEKLEDFKIKDEDFEIMKDEYSNTEKMKNEIEKTINNQNSIIKSLNEKIAKTGEIKKKTEQNRHMVTHINRLIQSALIISLSKKIPPTPRGRLIKTGMIISAIAIASKFITTEKTQKEIITVKYTDFSKDILSAIKDVGNVKTKIDDAFGDINTIRNKLKGQYKEFENQLSDYDELLDNLDYLEKDLHKQKIKIEKYDIEFKNVLKQNNQKIKRLKAIEKAS